MPKEDYLLKYLDKLSSKIAAMFKLRESGFPENAIEIADELYIEMLDVNVEDLALMPIEMFIKIIHNNKFNRNYLETLSQLAYQTAFSFQERGDTEKAKGFFIKTLQLYYLLNEKDKTYSFEREIMMEELKKITGTIY